MEDLSPYMTCMDIHVSLPTPIPLFLYTTKQTLPVGNIAGSMTAAALLASGWGYSFTVPGMAIGVLGVLVFLFLPVEPRSVGLMTDVSPWLLFSNLVGGSVLSFYAIRKRKRSLGLCSPEPSTPFV